MAVSVADYQLNPSLYPNAAIRDTMLNISPVLATLGASENVASIDVLSGVPTPQDVANLVTYSSKIASVVVDSGSTVTMNASQANKLKSKFTTFNSIIVSDNMQNFSQVISTLTTQSILSITITSGVPNTYDIPKLVANTKVTSVTSDTYAAPMTVAQANVLYSKFNNNTIVVFDTAANIFPSFNTLFNAPSVVHFRISTLTSSHSIDTLNTYISKIRRVTGTTGINAAGVTPSQAVKLISKWYSTGLNIAVGSEVDVFNNHVGEFVKYASRINGIHLPSGTSVTMTSAEAAVLSPKKSATGTFIINDSPATVTVENYLLNPSSTANIADTMGNISGSLASLADGASITVTSGVPSSEDVANLVTYASKIKSVIVDSGSFVTMTPSQANVLISKFSVNSIILSVGSENHVFGTCVGKFSGYATIINSATNVLSGSYVFMNSLNANTIGLSKFDNNAIELVLDTTTEPESSDATLYGVVAASSVVGRITATFIDNSTTYNNTLIANASKVLTIVYSSSLTVNMTVAQASAVYTKVNYDGGGIIHITNGDMSQVFLTMVATGSIYRCTIVSGSPTSSDINALFPFKTKIVSVTFGVKVTLTPTQFFWLCLLMSTASSATNSVIISVGSESSVFNSNANTIATATQAQKIESITNVPTGSFLTLTQLQANRFLTKVSTRCIIVSDSIYGFSTFIPTFFNSSSVEGMVITSGIPTAQNYADFVTYESRITSVTVDTGSRATYNPTQANLMITKFKTTGSMIISVGSDANTFQTNANNFELYKSIIYSITVNTGIFLRVDAIRAASFLSKCPNNSIIVNDSLDNILPSIATFSGSSKVNSLSITGVNPGRDVTDLVPYVSRISYILLDATQATALTISTSIMNRSMEITGLLSDSDVTNLSPYASKIYLVRVNVAQSLTLLSTINDNSIIVVDTMSAVSDSFETLSVSSKVAGFEITANRSFVDIRYFFNGVNVEAGKLYETDVENLFTIASKVNSVALLVSKVYMNVQQATALYLKFPDYSIVVEDTFANISGSLETLVASSKVFGIIVNSLSGVLSSVNFTTLETYFSDILTITSESSTMSVAQYEVLSPKTAGSVVVSDTLANLSTEVLLGYSTVSTATLTVKIGETTAETGADVQTRLTDLIAYDEIITSIQLSSEVTLSVVQLSDLNDDILSIGKIIVSDTWTAISGNLSAYITNTKIIGIVITSGVETEDVPNLVNVSKITGVAVGSGTVAMSVAQATDLLSKIEGTIVVSDSWSAISGNLSAYSTNTKIIGIVITSGVETGDVPNLVNVSKITSVAVGSETVTMSVAQATNLMSKIEGTINVSDTMAAILPKLVAYSTNDKIGNIVITSGQANASDIEILYDNRTKVRDVTVDAPVTMTALQAWSLYVKFNSNSIIVKDLWSAIVGKLSTFTASGKINSIVVSDTLANLNNGVLASILQNSATKSLTVKIGETVAETGAVVQTRLADLITYNSIITSVNTTGPVTMTSAQSAVLQSKFPSGSIISALYTLSGDPTNGSPYLVTSLLCNVRVVDSSGNEQLVIDFTHASKSTTFTQSNNNTIEIDTVLDLSNVSEVMFISATNQVTTRAVVAPASTIQSSAMSLFPVVWGGTQFNFQPISSFLDVLSGEERIQTASELANLYKTRGAFTVYLQQLNTSVYSEVAADLVLKPTTENAVATFKVTPTQMNELFTINDVAKTVTLNSSLESVFGKSWLDSFQITYSDLFPSGTYPVSFPKDNVITDMQKALFHVILPTATLLPTNYTSLLADPGATIQAEYNNGMQLRALVTHYFTTNAAGFHEAIQEAYTNTSTFTAFQKGDVIQWKVTLHVPLEGLGAPPGSSSGTSLSQPFSRVYLFQILVDDANFSSFDVTKYGKLVSEDDTAVGIFNTGNSNSATNKRTYPYQYVNLGNNAYVATGINKNTTKYGATSYQAASGANVIGDAYTNNV